MGASEAIQNYLDRIDHAVSLPTLFDAIAGHTTDEIADAAHQLAEDRAVNRVSVMTVNRKFFYAFYSVRIPTTIIHAPLVAAEPGPHILSQLPPVLSTDEAVDVLQRAGWVPEPETVTVERRGPDRRKLTAIDVIMRWKLPYRLSRIIDIIGGARTRPLTDTDAELVVRLVRDHVKPTEKESDSIAV